MRALLVMFFLVTVLLTASCEHVDPLEVGTEATLSNIQATIFTLNCAVSGCHAGSNPQQGQDLSAGQSFSNIVGVRSMERPDLFRIAPGDPDNSYLVQKIMGAPDIVGARMPLGRAPLSAEQINLIREWVAEGAPNN